MHYLSIGAMFRSENSWLDEWIRFHAAVGVEHFYLYNHDLDSRISDKILEPYVQSGLVENIHISEMKYLKGIPQRQRMNEIYRTIIGDAAGKTVWLGMIDLDEFILPRRCDDLREVMKSFEDYSGLAINWTSFGTSGQIRRPPTQINHLLHRGPQDWEWNGYVKSIIRPDQVALQDIYDVHHFPCHDGVTVNENYEKVTWMQHGISTETIRINHYLLRSWQDYWEVKATRPRYNGAEECNEDYFRRYDRNEIYDNEISKRFGDVIAERQ